MESGEAGAKRRRRAASARLRDETRDLHDRIERNPVAARMLADDVTLDDHRRMHVRLHGYHRPALDRVAGTLGRAMPDVVAAMADRVRWLEEDLRRLGTDPATVPAAPLPAAMDAAAAMGIVYVLEGSVLGGRIIARHLAERLGLGPGTGAAFYADPPAGTHPRWSDVCAWIDDWAAAQGKAAEDAMVAAARQSFVDLDRWFSEGGDASH
jgi:heme oxygenase (biliverdin-IX-beta and delta-forming)